MSTSERMQSLPVNKTGPRKVWNYLKRKFSTFFSKNDNIPVDKESFCQIDVESEQLEEGEGTVFIAVRRLAGLKFSICNCA